MAETYFKYRDQMNIITRILSSLIGGFTTQGSDLTT